MNQETDQLNNVPKSVVPVILRIACHPGMQHNTSLGEVEELDVTEDDEGPRIIDASICWEGLRCRTRPGAGLALHWPLAGLVTFQFATPAASEGRPAIRATDYGNCESERVLRSYL